MGARSSAPPEATTADGGPPPRAFPLGRLLVGVVLVALVIGPLVLALTRLRRPPDAGRLVYAAGQEVVVRDLATGMERRPARIPHGARFLLPSPDGDRIVYLERRGRIEVLDVRTGDRQPIRGQGYPVSWTPNGKPMLVVPHGGESNLVVVEGSGDLSRMMLRSLIEPGRWRLESEPVWLERDMFAVAVREEGSFELRVVDLDRFPDVAPRIRHTIAGARPLVASPDGRQLLFARGEAGNSVLEILSLRHLETQEVARAESFDGAALSRRGLIAVWGSANGSDALWVVSPVDPELHLLLGEGGTPLPGDLSTAAWSVDGSHVVFVHDGDIRSVGIEGTDLKTLVRDVRPDVLSVVRWQP